MSRYTFDEAAQCALGAEVLLGGHGIPYYHDRQAGTEGIANVFSEKVCEGQDKLQHEAFIDLCPNIYELIRGVILQ